MNKEHSLHQPTRNQNVRGQKSNSQIQKLAQEMKSPPKKLHHDLYKSMSHTSEHGQVQDRQAKSMVMSGASGREAGRHAHNLFSTGIYFKQEEPLQAHVEAHEGVAPRKGVTATDRFLA